MASVQNYCVAVTGAPVSSNAITINIGPTPDSYVHTWASETLAAGLVTLAAAINAAAQTWTQQYCAFAIGNVVQIYGYAPTMPYLKVTATSATLGVNVYTEPLPGQNSGVNNLAGYQNVQNS